MLRRVLIAASAAVALASTTVPAAAATDDVLNSGTALVAGVAFAPQTHALSCESAALEMALSHEGVAASQDAILAAIPVDDTAVIEDDSGDIRWGDPYAAFVGDVDGSEVDDSGYGTYYPTIATSARSLGGTVLFAGEGFAPAQLYRAVRDGHPVVAWITYDYLPHERHDYIAFDGATIPYAGPVEHAVTIAGVDAASVLVFDPDRGEIWIPQSTFEEVYAVYNQMAVVLR